MLALAHDEGLAVLPRGSGSAQGLGGPPDRADVVLDLARLDAVLEYSPDDLTVTVQAGVTAGALAAALAARRQTLPLDPPGWPRRTLGGIGGHRRQRSAATALRHHARSAARRALHPGRRRDHLGRRQGGQVGDRLRRPQAPGRLARHARRHRRADAAAAPATGSRGAPACCCCRARRPLRTRWRGSWTRRCNRTASSGSTPARWRRAACRRPRRRWRSRSAAWSRRCAPSTPRSRRPRRPPARGWRRWDRRSGGRTIARSPRPAVRCSGSPR